MSLLFEIYAWYGPIFNLNPIGRIFRFQPIVRISPLPPSDFDRCANISWLEFCRTIFFPLCLYFSFE